MKRFLPLLVCAALFGCATVGPRYSKDMSGVAVPFAAAPRNAEFPVEGRFGGTCRMNLDSLELDFQHADVQILPYSTYNGARQITALKAGLAHQLPDGRWASSHWVVVATVDRSARVGDKLTFDHLRPARIPILPTVDLSQHWLVLSVESYPLDRPKAEQRVGSSYAHGAHDMFVTAKAP